MCGLVAFFVYEATLATNPIVRFLIDCLWYLMPMSTPRFLSLFFKIVPVSAGKDASLGLPPETFQAHGDVIGTYKPSSLR